MKGNKFLGMFGVLVAIATLATIAARAQDNSTAVQKKQVSVKVLVVFEEYDGSKKVASLPYTFRVIAFNAPNPRSDGRASIRDGLKVPISNGGGGFQYMDVGANMDCGAVYNDDGAFRVSLSVQRTFLFTPDELKPAMDLNKATIGVGGNPVIQTFSSSYDLLMRDGQSIEATTVTNPLNGRVLKVFVTINVEK